MAESPPVAATPPVSAVSGAVGLAGLAGLAGWLLVARSFGMDGPLAAMTGLLACGVPMVLWSLLADKVHRRPSTGIDWSAPRAIAGIIDVSTTKLAGLWATWGLIALCYGLFRWYWDGQYLFAMQVLGWAAPVLLVLSVPYVIWLDRVLVQPRDATWHFGAMLIGREAWDRHEIANHLRAWAVKGFFLAFMISIVPGGFGEIVRADWTAMTGNPAALAQLAITALFVIDVQFATVGYALTLRPLDSHIRTANPYLDGWLAALICYPPFILMNAGGPLDYHTGTADWSQWLAMHPWALWVWGAALVILTAIYAWATVAFGLRFSNLTHRGIITHGPYRLTKHPAYWSKNLFWWLATLPMLSASGYWTDAARNTALLALVSAVYGWRALTEERHLAADPDYRAYRDWAHAHAPVPRLVRWLLGARRRGGGAVAPAE